MHSSHNPIVQCIRTISKESINNVSNQNHALSYIVDGNVSIELSDQIITPGCRLRLSKLKIVCIEYMKTA